MLRFWIKESVFSAVRLCTSPFIKFQVEFEDGVSEKNLHESEVFFALPENSISDLVALDKYTESLNVASPIGRSNISSLQNFICLIRPVYDPLKGKIKRPLPQNLSEIINLESENIKLLPVSFYWGKHPEKQRSIFKILFSQSWSASSPFKKFFRIVFHGRSLIMRINKPLYLNELRDDKRTEKENSHLINRYLRALFRKTKQAAIGPDISHRRTLVQALRGDKEVIGEIERQSGEEIKKKKALKKKAYKYANEICSDINYPIVRLLQRGLSWFWNTRYDGINIHNLDKIKSIASTNALIYVPCHRSHIDYLALSYILLEKNLMLPHIAAGNNLNLPFLGKVLRGGGAFFMRRSFVTNKLYSIIFFQYLKRLMQRGSSIEFFPEGGRSRNGFSLPARPGLLSMTIRSFAGLNIDNVKLIPTYLGYEKIIEGNSYLSELLGTRKKRESIFDVFKSIQDFSNFLGNAYINFGDPIDLKTFLNKELEGKNYYISSSLDRPDWLRSATSSLGLEVMKGINNSVAVTSSSLFSLSLLSETTQNLDSVVMKSRIKMFINLLKKNKIYKHVWITDEDPKEIIEKTESLSLLKPQVIKGSRVYKPNKNEAALLSYYQNNISHLFLLYSLICLALKYVKDLSKKELLRLVHLVYPFLQSDFYLPWKEEEIDEVIEKSLAVLIELELISIDSSQALRKPSLKGENCHQYLALSNICESSIKRFYIVMNTLWIREKIYLSDLQNSCVSIANKLQNIEGWLYSEFSDQSKFKIFIEKLLQDKYVKEDADKKISALRITKRVQIDFERFFNPEFMQVVNQFNLRE
mgnify:CR=1 FL=1